MEITANTLNPGAISSNLFRHMTIVNGNNIPSFCFLFLSPFRLVPASNCYNGMCSALCLLSISQIEHLALTDAKS